MLQRSSDMKEPFTKEEISNLVTSITNSIIKNLTAYQYLITSNPVEEIERYPAVVQTPSIPPPLSVAKDLNEVIIAPEPNISTPVSVKSPKTSKTSKK
jgi:hypothetical protein